jgi:hypothetical protein
MMAQGGNDPTLGYQNGVFDFGLIECQQIQVIPVDQPVGSALLIRFTRWPGINMT